MKKSGVNTVLKESEEESLTLDDRMRLSLNKFKKMFGYIFIIVIFVFIFSGMGLYYITTIGVYLEDLEFDFPLIDGDSIFFFVEQVQLTIMMSIAIVIVALIWVFSKGRKIHHELSDLQDTKIRQSYFLTFETTVPKGDTPTERIFYMISKVFPEIKEAIKKAEKKPKKFQYEVDKKIKGAVYDLTQNTDEGILLVKFMEEQTYDELINIVKKANKIAEKVKVFRLLCIGKDFDNVFQDYGFEGRMDDLGRKFKLDLILEDKKGYSMVWID